MTTAKQKQIILNDLTKDLRCRVALNIEDYMDTCRRAGLRYPDAASDLMTFFSGLAASYAAFQFEVSEEQFLQIMRIQFRHALKKVTE